MFVCTLNVLILKFMFGSQKFVYSSVTLIVKIWVNRKYMELCRSSTRSCVVHGSFQAALSVARILLNLGTVTSCVFSILRHIKIQKVYGWETWATVSHSYIPRIPGNSHGRRVRDYWSLGSECLSRYRTGLGPDPTKY